MMRVAIVGAGPSGFFVAGELLKRGGVEVHVIERRVAPYGLVRYGVAPDHLVTRRSTLIFNQVAAMPGFFYHGNVDVGRDMAWADLNAAFHAVVACTGAERPNRPDCPGATLPGVADALSLSRWANGEPEGLPADWLSAGGPVVIVGNGNVALDAVRLLARSSADWVATDMAPAAMEQLAHHRVDRITVVGRRGAAEASFTEAELAEAIALPGWAVEADEPLPFGIVADKPASARRLVFRFHQEVARIEGEARVERVVLRDRRTGDESALAVGAVLFATGHRGEPVAGLPFDATRGVVPNDRGRVDGAPGWYVCGWIKRGARGLVGHNRKDAIETVAAMLEDRAVWSARVVTEPRWPEGVRRISWSDWKRLDAMEVQRGAAVGRPRLAFTRAEALAALAG